MLQTKWLAKVDLGTEQKESNQCGKRDAWWPILTLLQPTRNKPKSPLYYQPEINRNVISPTIDDQAEINRNLIANILVLYKRVIQVFIKLFMSIFHQKHIQEVY